MHKSIRRKFIIYILPVILIILVVGCTYGILNSKKIAEQEIAQELISSREQRTSEVKNKISEIESATNTFSSNISNTYQYLDIDTYKEILTDTLVNNSTFYSCGIWFEPYTIDPKEKYKSAYAVNSNGSISNSDYYNSEEFDYLNNELYLRSKQANYSFFTEAKYDQDIDSYYVVYVAPIQDENGDFIGCVTSTFGMNELKHYIDSYADNSINFYIVNSDGVYIANNDTSLVASQANILDTDSNFKENAESILTSETGLFTYKKDNQKYYIFYNTFYDFNWKLIYEIPKSLVNKPLSQIIFVNIAIFVFALSSIIALIFFFSNKFVHTPFQLLLTEFDNISNNNFNSDITKKLLKTDTEFSEVGKALESMKLSLAEYKKDIEDKNKLLGENEKNLMEAINYNNAIINALPIIMFVFDRDGYCIECYGSDRFFDREPGFYVGKHPNDVLGKNNCESKDLLDFLSIIKTIDYSDGIIRKELPVILYDNHEVFDHSLTLCSDNRVISLCRRITDTVNQMESIKYLSNYDKLTGVFNTRYFNDVLENFVSPEKLPISVVVLDVNGFKAINDEHGHSTCDTLLIDLANTLNKIDVPNKIIGRIAGDEFAVVLPNTTKDDAEEIFEKINSQCLSTIVFKVPFSISFGIDTVESETDLLIDIGASAEELLYKQKIYTSSGKKDNTIELINSTLLAKNKREQLHSNRVSELCLEMAKILGWSKLDQNKIKTAGLLHDIGKIGISDALLNKPGKLTDDEYAELCTHPEIGYRILQSSSNMKELSEYAYAHHEKWDGTGYPRGLKGTEIVIEARIIAIIDTYDAMTSSRSYRDGLPKEVAIKELIRCKNTQFDPELVDIFIEKVLHEKLSDYQI